MNDIAGFNIHRGCLAHRSAGRRPPTLDRIAAGPLSRVLVLEGVNNPDNVGGLFRSAAAFGIELVVLGPNCGDPLYRKAIRTSMARDACRCRSRRRRSGPARSRDLRADGFTVVALTPATAPSRRSKRYFRTRSSRCWSARRAAASAAEAMRAATLRIRIPTTAGRRLAERHDRGLDRDVSLLRGTTRTTSLPEMDVRRRGVEVSDRADADRSGVGGAGTDLVHVVGAHAGAARVGGAAARVPGCRSCTTLHIETDLLADVPMDRVDVDAAGQRQSVRDAERVRRRHVAAAPCGCTPRSR